MKKKSLKLEDLKIQSFVTEINYPHINTIRAGSGQCGSEDGGDCGGGGPVVEDEEGDNKDDKETGGVIFCTLGCTLICP